MQTWKSMSLLIDGKTYKTHEPAMNSLHSHVKQWFMHM